jgi:hypothetical protein
MDTLFIRPVNASHARRSHGPWEECSQRAGNKGPLLIWELGQVPLKPHGHCDLGQQPESWAHFSRGLAPIVGAILGFNCCRMEPPPAPWTVGQ